MVAADNADILLCCAMMLYSLYSGRGVYLDIALICALFGIIDTIAVGRYLDRKGRFDHADSDHH
jgi:multisubunit Na+/H+ antiporter MnhF subunit